MNKSVYNFFKSSFSNRLHKTLFSFQIFVLGFKRVERGGLYRLDLADISNGVRHEAPPELIVRDAHLGSFTVDHADFRLLVAHLRRNTVLAVSLDG